MFRVSEPDGKTCKVTQCEGCGISTGLRYSPEPKGSMMRLPLCLGTCSVEPAWAEISEGLQERTLCEPAYLGRYSGNRLIGS